MNAAVATLKRSAKPGAPPERLGNKSWLADLGHLPSLSIRCKSSFRSFVWVVWWWWCVGVFVCGCVGGGRRARVPFYT